ncbi:putative reductase [compost metagenome]
MLKSVVTQASSAIPVMPLYISIVFKIMKAQGIHEGCIEQIQRLFATKLYSGTAPDTDEKHRLRLDDWELRDDVQNTCREIWAQIDDSNINELTDYLGYKAEFLRLFGFGLQGVDYEADLSGEVKFDVIELV